MTAKEKIWEEIFNIFSTHSEQKYWETGESEFIVSDEGRDELINALTGYVWERLGNEPEEDDEIDSLDIKNASKAKQVWAEKVREILEPQSNDDVAVYNEPEDEDNEVYDDGFAHCTRNHVRFATWVGEVGDKEAKRRLGVWVRKVERAIAKVE